MMSSDKRIIIRIIYSSVWWFSFIGAMMLETTGGKYYAIFSSIVFAVVLYADAKLESLEESNRRRGKRIQKKFSEDLDAAMNYKPRKKEW